MRQIFILVMLLLFCAPPSQADSPVWRVHKMLVKAGYPIDGVAGPKSIRVDCTHCTQQQMTEAYALAQAADWTVHPDPDINGFLIAVNNDAIVQQNPSLIFDMANMLTIFQADMTAMQQTEDPTILQSHWSLAKSTYGATWLTTPVQNMILGYATTYSIPLVASP